MATAQRGGSLQAVPGASTTRWAARLALVGIIGTVYFIVALTAMHFLRPDDIVRYGTNIGFYSVGPYGSIFVAAFVALGLAGLALAYIYPASRRRYPRGCHAPMMVVRLW